MIIDDDFITNLLPNFNCCLFHLNNFKLCNKTIYNMVTNNKKYKNILIEILKNDRIFFKNKYETYLKRFENVLDDVAYMYFDNQYLDISSASDDDDDDDDEIDIIDLDIDNNYLELNN